MAGVRTVVIETLYAPDVVSTGDANPNMATSGEQTGTNPAWAAGYTGDTYCKDCGELIAKGKVVPAKGHGKTELKGDKDATATEEGYTGDAHCTDCGDKVADGEVIPVVDSENPATNDATCLLLLVTFAVLSAAGAMAMVSRKKLF